MVGYKVSVKVWPAPWPAASWKWAFKRNGIKETKGTYYALLMWLRLLFGLQSLFDSVFCIQHSDGFVCLLLDWLYITGMHSH
jgi:hypothetical protein